VSTAIPAVTTHRADQGDAALLQVGQRHQRDPQHHHHQRAGHQGGPAVQGQQHRRGAEREGDRGRVGVAELPQRRPDLGEEVVALDRDAEHLAELAGGDHQPHAGLEAGQHRRGDEVGQVPQAQQPGGRQDGADQQGQQGRGGRRLPGIAGGAGIASAPAVRIEMVEVELTLSGREVPSSA
jgi:hypothetical protein